MNDVTCEICSKVQPADDCWTVKQNDKITYHCRTNSLKCEKKIIKPHYTRKDDSFRIINMSSPTLQCGGYYSYIDYESWAKESDKIIKAKEEEKHKFANEEKEKQKAWISTLRAKNGDYWKGPYDVLVPWSIKQIHSEDGINYLSYAKDVFKDDGYIVISTELYTNNPPLTETEYKNKFTKKIGTNFIYVGYEED